MVRKEITSCGVLKIFHGILSAKAGTFKQLIKELQDFQAKSATKPAILERVITATNTMQSMLIQLYIACKSITLEYAKFWLKIRVYLV